MNYYKKIILVIIIFLLTINIYGNNKTWKVSKIINIKDLEPNSKAFYVNRNGEIYYDYLNCENKFVLKNYSNPNEIYITNFEYNGEIKLNKYSLKLPIDINKFDIFFVDEKNKNIIRYNLKTLKYENLGIKNEELANFLLIINDNQIHEYYYNEFLIVTLNSIFKINNNNLFFKESYYSDYIYEPLSEINILKYNLEKDIINKISTDYVNLFFNNSDFVDISPNGEKIKGIPCLEEIQRIINKFNFKFNNYNFIYRSNMKSSLYFNEDIKKIFTTIEINDGTKPNFNYIKPYLQSIENAIVIYNYKKKNLSVDKILTSKDIPELDDDMIILEEILYADNNKILISVRKVIDEDYILSREIPSSWSKRKYERELWELSYE